MTSGYAYSWDPSGLPAVRGDDPSEWLKPMCEAWGKQWRRVHNVKDDGWPAISLLGRELTREDDLGTRTGLRQGFAEVFTGDALIINRSLIGAPWVVREIIAAHYVVQRIKYQTRAHHLGLKVGMYWDRWRCAHWYIAGRLHGLRMAEALS